MQRMHLRLASVAGLTVIALAAAAPAAFAHEERNVGNYHFAVGFGAEPAYAGYVNSVQLLLADAKDKPVTDLADTLKVEVQQGGDKTDLSLQPDFEIGQSGTPGDYRAWFIPTAPGAYTFHFTGMIKRQRIDQSFTSSATTFDDVQDPSAVEFPAKPPTTAQLAQRLDRELPRLESKTSASNTRDDAHQARTLAIVGIVIGALGLLAGGAGFLRRRG